MYGRRDRQGLSVSFVSGRRVDASVAPVAAWALGGSVPASVVVTAHRRWAGGTRWHMSVGVALSASDGVVVLADGRTSHLVGGEAQSDTTVKLVVAPQDLPFVVVPLGRASVNGVVAADLVELVLDALPYEDLRTMDLRTVTLCLVSALVAADAVCPQEGVGDKGQYLRTGFSLLVAGYGATTPPENAEVWTATVPTRGLPPELSKEPVTVCGPGEESDTLVHDLFDSFNDELKDGTLADGQDTYRLRGLSMTQVRERAEAMLRTAADMYPRDLLAGGVGGRWLLAQVGPDGRIKLDSADIGPMVDHG